MENKSHIQDDRRDALRDLTPSEKLVFKILQYMGELTQKELAEETCLSQQTVRYAIQTLEENGVITSRVFIQDARQRLYSITDSSHTDGTDQS